MTRTQQFASASRWLLIGAALLAASGLALQARAATGSLADVRIYDRSQGRYLPMYWHEGRAYVVGNPGNEYEIVVRNRTVDDVLAVVSVDGIDALSGRTASPREGGYVVAEGESTRIRGWRKSMDETAAFYFTSLGDSYAGRTGRPANVGVIGVALFERKRQFIPWSGSPGSRGEKRSEAQEDAAPRAKGYRAPSAPLGTGHGRREDSPARYAEFERASREPAEVVTIYYDSRRNLVAQGVIPRAYGRRDPDPFPRGFVPDPPRWR